MTDTKTGAGAEGAPRDEKPTGRSTTPATAAGPAPAATGEPASVPRGATAPGTLPPGDPTASGATRAAGEGRESTAGGESAAGPGAAPGALGSPGREPTRTPVTQDAHTTEGTSAPSSTARERHGTGSDLFPHDEGDKLSLRLQHAVTGFVDGPRAAVEEADHVLEEVAARFTDAVTRRRRALRMAWQAADGGEDKPARSADTEQLRLALRDYRELTERLLHL